MRITQSSKFLAALVVAATSTQFLVGCLDYDVPNVKYVPMTVEVDDWRDEVIYQMLTDRFADGDPRNNYRVNEAALARYQGGDWQGIIDRLDYLEKLGVTTLWISPVVKNVDHDAGFDAYHGYWAVDLESVNPHFGDLTTLRRMVDEVHARGMKVVLDIVTNHLGQVFYYDINNNGQPDEWLEGSAEQALDRDASGNIILDENGNPVEEDIGPAGGSATTERGSVTRTTEYDPDFDPAGIQSFTSLGLAGPAPIRFFDMPEIYRVPPLPKLFQNPDVYYRRGRVTNWNSVTQTETGDFPGGLKDINTTIPEVREELIRVYTDWILKTNIDGFRIDTIKHVEHEFWEVFGREVRKILAEKGKTNFFMFGEAFDGSDSRIGSYTFENQLDSVFYFSQKYNVYSRVFINGGATSVIQQLYDLRATNYNQTPQPGGITAPDPENPGQRVGVAPHDALVNFIDNHDVARFLFENPDRNALRVALSYLLTQDGIPCIYYGTEQDFDGGNDPANRERLWDTGYPTDGETFRHIARLTEIRKKYEALRKGDFRITWTTDNVAEELDAGIVAFERTTSQGHYALVAINVSAEKESSTQSPEGDRMLVSAPPGAVLRDVLSDEVYTVGSDQTLSVEVPSQGARILIPEGDVL